MFKKFLLLCALGASAVTSFAQQCVTSGNFSGGIPYAFCGPACTNGTSTGPNFQSNVAWFCTSAKNPGIARLFNIFASGDLSPTLAGGGISTYFSTNQNTITNAGISGTNQLWLDCTGFASNDVLVVRSVLNDTYQRLIVTNNFNVIPAANTNNALQVWPSLAFPTAVGDIVYKMTPGASLAVPLIWTNFPANPILYGQAGKPLLVEMQYSNAGSIKLLSGDYFPLTYPLSR